MITNQNEPKTITRQISSDCKFKFNSTTCNSNQKWNNETCQCDCKNYCCVRLQLILAHVFVKIVNI